MREDRESTSMVRPTLGSKTAKEQHYSSDHHPFSLSVQTFPRIISKTVFQSHRSPTGRLSPILLDVLCFSFSAIRSVICCCSRCSLPLVSSWKHDKHSLLYFIALCFRDRVLMLFTRCTDVVNTSLKADSRLHDKTLSRCAGEAAHSVLKWS